MLCENADPSVRADLETFMGDLVPDGDPRFRHRDEGPDDMSAHVRTVLTQTGLSIPVQHGACALGTWQGVYLWEHRTHGHRRRLTVTVTGLA
jgi:secondary thiamine-phosphate synthase enzyme